MLEVVLDKAIVVFSEFGYPATSLGKLTEATGLTEGSIYKAFKDKHALFLAALERYVELRAARLEQALSRAPTGFEQVRAVLELYVEYSSGAAGRRGCLVVGSAVDLASSDTEVAKRVDLIFKMHEKRLVHCVRQGQDDGSIRADVDAESVGRLLVCVLHGMRVLGKTGRSREDMTRPIEQALKLIK
ncbi:TetR/AcrR family transcriptional regulator [Dyella sp. A6]|uniref:TetR/AcrR family transcriptional regulator n=1 Tax=Dyella aluminiiresistens TaxID=3069105 RepID=UPI002E768E21|nr:TetR/AcrR family transcriptional regulator [Dyella sp. A6]